MLIYVKKPSRVFLSDEIVENNQIKKGLKF